MTISVKLTESFSAINKKINHVLSKELNKRITKNTRQATRMFMAAIPIWIRQQPEIQSLLAHGTPGSLNAKFGLSPGSASGAVDSIISAVVSSMHIKIAKVSSRLQGAVEFNFQSTDFVNLLNLGDGHQRTELGADLHWLDWLLTKGDIVIIKGYHYEPSSGGRSRGGTMGQSGFFRVDPQYSGTETDNFITRAFLGREREISQILVSLLRQ